MDDILSGGNKVVTREQLSRDLCYNKEMNSDLSYCDEHYKNTYPCAPGVAYYDRGALPIYWYLPYQLLQLFFVNINYNNIDHTSFISLHLNYFIILCRSILSKVKNSLKFLCLSTKTNRNEILF